MPYRNKAGDIISDAQFRKLSVDEKKIWTYQDDPEEDAGYDSGIEEELSEDGDYEEEEELFEEPDYDLEDE